MAVPGLDPGIRPGHPASRLIALILRSSREAASRRRIFGSLEPPSRRRFSAAPQDEAKRDERNHRPGHPLPSWPALCRPSRSGEVLCFVDRDHRHEPGDDGKSGARCHVLTLFLTLCITRARPLLIPARRGARSRGVARVGRGAVLQQASHACWREGPWQPWAGPSLNA
jgi:hypothetical protein